MGKIVDEMFDWVKGMGAELVFEVDNKMAVFNKGECYYIFILGKFGYNYRKCFSEQEFVDLINIASGIQTQVKMKNPTSLNKVDFKHLGEIELS